MSKPTTTRAHAPIVYLIDGSDEDYALLRAETPGGYKYAERVREMLRRDAAALRRAQREKGDH